MVLPEELWRKHLGSRCPAPPGAGRWTHRAVGVPGQADEGRGLVGGATRTQPGCLELAPALPPDPAFAPCCVVFARGRPTVELQAAAGTGQPRHGQERLRRSTEWGQWARSWTQVCGLGPDGAADGMRSPPGGRGLKCRSQRRAGLGLVCGDGRGVTASNLAPATGLCLEARQKRKFVEAPQGGFSTGAAGAASISGPGWQHTMPPDARTAERTLCSGWQRGQRQPGSS
jgi:hypothetical protein